MKKCLHLKKTKPHWRRKPPKVVTWKDRADVERRERQRRLTFDSGMEMGAHMSIAAVALLTGQRMR